MCQEEVDQRPTFVRTKDFKTLLCQAKRNLFSPTNITAKSNRETFFYLFLIRNNAQENYYKENYSCKYHHAIFYIFCCQRGEISRADLNMISFFFEKLETEQDLEIKR